MLIRSLLYALNLFHKELLFVKNVTPQFQVYVTCAKKLIPLEFIQILNIRKIEVCLIA